MTQALEAAVTRNAQLALRLRKTIAALHRTAAGHSRFVRWVTCPHPDCRAVAELLAIHYECERCHQIFPLGPGAVGKMCSRCNDLGALAML